MIVFKETHNFHLKMYQENHILTLKVLLRLFTFLNSTLLETVFVRVQTGKQKYPQVFKGEGI